ncbi:NAD(P)-dependent oxidoreductase [Desulfotomaculum sp. 1211_IL3151]
MLAKKRVLVTGASGFIGTHLIKRLGQENVKVGAVIRSNQSCIKEDNDIEIIQSDLNDFVNLQRQVHCFRPDIVYHLAGVRPQGYNWQAIQEAYEINFLGTMNLFHALDGLKCESVILAGSAAEYGRGPAPYQEHQGLQAVSAYGSAKAAATSLGKLCYEYFKLPVVTLRFTLIYGPGQDESFFISQLIKTLLAGQPFPMTGGEQYRDFIYVSDVVEALWLAANNPRAAGGIFNIGQGFSQPIKDVAILIATMLDCSERLEIGKMTYKKGEQFAYCVDTNLARQVLQWQPKVALMQGLKETIQWFKRSQAGCP